MYMILVCLTQHMIFVCFTLYRYLAEKGGFSLAPSHVQGGIRDLAEFKRGATQQSLPAVV
jgi:hypothetical protein